MYLARHRWMDPAMGRWVTRDPAGYVDGGNLNQHTRSSPAVFRDPSGLNAEKEECHNDGDIRLATVKTIIATRNMDPKTAQNIRNTLIITSLAEAYIVASGFSRVHGVAKDRLAAMKSMFDTVNKNTVSPSFVSIATARLRDQKEILLKKML